MKNWNICSLFLIVVSIAAPPAGARRADIVCRRQKCSTRSPLQHAKTSTSPLQIPQRRRLDPVQVLPLVPRRPKPRPPLAPLLFLVAVDTTLFLWDTKFLIERLREAIDALKTTNLRVHLRQQFDYCKQRLRQSLRIPRSAIDLFRVLSNAIDLLVIPGTFSACVHIWRRWQLPSNRIECYTKYLPDLFNNLLKFYVVGPKDITAGRYGNIFRSTLSHREKDHLDSNLSVFIATAPKVLFWLKVTNGLPFWPLFVVSPPAEYIFEAHYQKQVHGRTRWRAYGLSGVVCAVQAASHRADGRSFLRSCGTLFSLFLEACYDHHYNEENVGHGAHLGGAVCGAVYAEVNQYWITTRHNNREVTMTNVTTLLDSTEH